jgi:hypothetical protein
MGDKSSKAKQRSLQQKNKARSDGEARAQTKQSNFSQAKPLGILEKK